jgi:hypothetical protein
MGDDSNSSSDSGSKDSSSKEQLAAVKAALAAQKGERSEVEGGAKKPKTDAGEKVEKGGKKSPSGEAGRSAGNQAIPHSVSAEGNKPENRGSESKSSDSSDE